jgi:alkylhydroperoxidase/carboxymuconolactone decarboxylase family protein YurZ
MGEQQLRITTLENDKNETIAKLGLLHQQQVDILEAQNAKLLSQHQAMRSQHDAQREQIESLRQQMASMAKLEAGLAEERRLHEQQLAALMKERVGEETQKFKEVMAQREKEFATREQRLQTEFQLVLDKRLNDAAESHRLQLDSLRAEIVYRDETLARLTKELAEIKASVSQREEMAADAFLHRLESLGMNFVVFHPGAGHLSVPVPELEQYVENPLGYAAAKCLVSEDQYRMWLSHYENPRCNAPLGENKCCDARLIRIDSPTRFVAGQSDRCARHQAADSAIDNVLRFR